MAYLLRGNSFLLLLLRALRECTGNGNGDRLTGTSLWIDFMRVFDDRYNPKKAINDANREVFTDGYKKLRQYFSEYLSGVFHFGSAYLPQKLPEKAKSIFSSDLDDSAFRKALERLNYACNKYFNLSDNENEHEAQNELVLEKLVAGIIETIKDDDTFEGPFFTGKKIVQKKDLYAENDYILQLFLFDVCYKIVTEHYGETAEGRVTCEEWTQSKKRTNTYEPRIMVLPIGQERAKTLRVIKIEDVKRLDYAQIYQQLLNIYRPTRRPPLPTEIEPKLKAHIDHWFETYKNHDIPIKTPQMLHVFFQYPECNLLKILNAVVPDAYYKYSSGKIIESKDAIDSNRHGISKNGKNLYGEGLAHDCQVSCERCKMKKDAHYTEKSEENFFDLIRIGMRKLQNELSVLSDDDYIMQWNRLFCTNSKNS